MSGIRAFLLVLACVAAVLMYGSRAHALTLRAKVSADDGLELVREVDEAVLEQNRNLLEENEKLRSDQKHLVSAIEKLKAAVKGEGDVECEYAQSETLGILVEKMMSLEESYERLREENEELKNYVVVVNNELEKEKAKGASLEREDSSSQLSTGAERGAPMSVDTLRTASRSVLNSALDWWTAATREFVTEMHALSFDFVIALPDYPAVLVLNTPTVRRAKQSIVAFLVRLNQLPPVYLFGLVCLILVNAAMIFYVSFSRVCYGRKKYEGISQVSKHARRAERRKARVIRGQRRSTASRSIFTPVESEVPSSSSASLRAITPHASRESAAATPVRAVIGGANSLLSRASPCVVSYRGRQNREHTDAASTTTTPVSARHTSFSSSSSRRSSAFKQKQKEASDNSSYYEADFVPDLRTPGRY